MVSQETPRLLFVHAHPDDESLTTGATIAHYSARGAQVRVVTCTLGEEGEVIDDQWAQLAVDHADQLGGYRIGELAAALRALGADGRSFSAARAAGATPACRHPTAAPAEVRRRRQTRNRRRARGRHPRIASSRRRDLRPQRGYGHPDHVHTHLVTTAAVAAAGSADYPARRGGCRRCTGP
ncbi:glcNAc-PI de-N-acetylase family protein [Mycobacterium xenopi 4042]|uniref:GlcNAc-PI de-N-acetylase family protein n=1 Tax=Mycobacterium xenopi 4042 TaxID=1299334 RepID=X8DX85_MYCXE|nr:glcNAc-PI de-N-acetylase family protein [Mycobacterium xenopi 4042]